jgi:hypothetical protein
LINKKFANIKDLNNLCYSSKLNLNSIKIENDDLKYILDYLNAQKQNKQKKYEYYVNNVNSMCSFIIYEKNKIGIIL